jgi:protein SCO1/2
MPTRRELLTGELRASASPARAAQPRKMYGAEYFSNLTLITHEGRKVRFYDDLIRGKIVAFNMMYVRCTDTCPLTTANLVRVQKLLGERLGRDVFMYSVSLTPRLDTPSLLRKYAESHKVGPGWLFLTGEPGDIQRVRTRLGFTDPDPKVDRKVTSHTGMMRIGNDRYDRWGMAPAMARPEQIVATINHFDRSMARTAARPA